MTKNEQRFALRMNMIVDLYDSGCYSFEDIGMVFGVTKERVRQVYRKGTGRVALPDWVLTEFLHSIENAPTVSNEYMRGYEDAKRAQAMKQRLIDAEALKAELTGRIALPDWVLTAVLDIIENSPTIEARPIGDLREGDNNG